MVSEFFIPTNQSKPNNYKEAISCKKAALWRAATEEEYQSLRKNGTWILTSLPAGKNTTTSHWIFKVKPGLNDTSPRYKANGYKQRQRNDYGESYAHVVTYNSLHVFLRTTKDHLKGVPSYPSNKWTPTMEKINEELLMQTTPYKKAVG